MKAGDRVVCIFDYWDDSLGNDPKINEVDDKTHDSDVERLQEVHERVYA